MSLAAIPLIALGQNARLPETPGPFFEPGFPFYQTQIDLTMKAGPLAENFAVRGLIFPLDGGMVLGFDQDLLRVAGVWSVPEGQPPVTILNMAQISYARPFDKAGLRHAQPTGAVHFATGLKLGAAATADALKGDPRGRNRTGDLGRGPLPRELGGFEGIEDCGAKAVLHYRVGKTKVREWHESRTISGQAVVLRHFAVEPCQTPLHFSIGPAAVLDWDDVRGQPRTPRFKGAPGQWVVAEKRLASCAVGDGKAAAATNSDAFTLAERDGELFATLAPSTREQRVTLALVPSVGNEQALAGKIGATPTPPAKAKTRRWPETIVTGITPDSVKTSGLALDLIGLPAKTPWKRRVRTADIGFLTPNRAAVLTYDGDLWIVNGLEKPESSKIEWQRFAAGLHEPLALAVVDGVVQVATKNGIVRVHDRDGNGEADWYENFCDAMWQSQSTRSFPLDMDIGPDGSTYVTQGGIPLGGGGTPYLGSVARVSPDGRTAEIVSTGGREPYVTVHPRTGLLTGTDQQGQFVPSSVAYVIRPGDSFGFGEEKPAKLTQPLVWIPHTEDNSAASQVWLTGRKFGPLEDRLLHLSYGNGGLFLVSPDLEAPVPQGALIPLEFDTRIPLLQGRMQPDGAAVWLAGFKIYDSRSPHLQALARLRPSGEPFTKPVSALSCSGGVILRFAAPLDAESVRAENVSAQSWNYLRTKAYGSGRYRKDGSAGMDAAGVSQAVVSADRRSVFIHLPELTGPVMQLEVRHAFRLESGAAAEGATYFTIHEPRQIDLAKAGFPKIDLGKTAIVSRPQIEGMPTEAIGKTLSVTMGCVACHSTDGTTEGKTGPTWKGIFGIDREFVDGSMESANEFYIRDSILNPQSKIVKGYLPGMASYKGVLTDAQIDSLILYIRSLK